MFRFAVSAAQNATFCEDGKPGGEIVARNLDTLHLQGRTAEHTQQAHEFTCDNLVHAGNAVLEATVRGREARGESVVGFEFQPITVDKIKASFNATQTDGCATQRKANRLILQDIKDAADRMQGAEQAIIRDSNADSILADDEQRSLALVDLAVAENEFMSVYCMLHIAMNFCTAVERGLASQDREELLSQVRDFEEDEKTDSLAGHSPMEKEGIGAAAIWALTKFFSDKAKDERVCRGNEYRAWMERDGSAHLQHIEPFAALLGNRIIARLQNAIRIQQMVVDPAIGMAFCRTCCAKYPELRELVDPEIWEKTASTERFCAGCFTRSRKLNRLSQFCLLALKSKKVLAHMAIYGYVHEEVMMPTIKISADRRAMDCVNFVQTLVGGMRKLCADPKPCFEGTERLLQDYVTVELTVVDLAGNASDSEICKAAGRVIYLQELLQAAQVIVDEHVQVDQQGYLKSPKADVKQVVEVAIRTAVIPHLRTELGSAELQAGFDKLQPQELDFSVHAALHSPRKFNHTQSLAAGVILDILQRLKIVGVEMSKTLYRQGGEWIALGGVQHVPMRHATVGFDTVGFDENNMREHSAAYRREQRAKFSSVLSTAALSERLIGQIDWQVRRAPRANTTFAATLVMAVQNRTIPRHQKLRRDNPAAADAAIDGAEKDAKRRKAVDQKWDAENKAMIAANVEDEREDRQKKDQVLRDKKALIIATPLVRDMEEVEAMAIKPLKLLLQAWKVYIGAKFPYQPIGTGLGSLDMAVGKAGVGARDELMGKPEKDCCLQRMRWVLQKLHELEPELQLHAPETAPSQLGAPKMKAASPKSGAPQMKPVPSRTAPTPLPPAPPGEPEKPAALAPPDPNLPLLGAPKDLPLSDSARRAGADAEKEWSRYGAPPEVVASQGARAAQAQAEIEANGRGGRRRKAPDKLADEREKPQWETRQKPRRG